jgi:hypothetical protein
MSAKKIQPKPENEIPEIDPDAFERFRGAVHALAKAKPQHRAAPKSKRRGPGSARGAALKKAKKDAPKDGRD